MLLNYLFSHVLKIRISSKKEVLYTFKSHRMSKIKLYIATSIDGYIARKNNSLNWLYAIENPNNIDHDYGEFLSGIDTVVMGRKTYEEIISFGVDWPYADCDTYIFTSSSELKIQTPRTTSLQNLNANAIDQLKKKCKKDIWIVGGGSLISGFIDLEAIDEMTITIIPILLGEGIQLFPNHPKETKLELLSAKPFETGAVNLKYQRTN
jgi:dihydrofolate reductase